MGKNKKNNKPLSEVIRNVVIQLGSNTKKSYTIFTHIQLTFENLKLHIQKKAFMQKILTAKTFENLGTL